MADKNWRTNPDIQLARRIAVEKKAAAAIVIYIMPDGAFGVASYGKDGPICTATGRVADELYEQFRLGSGPINGLMDILYGA